jgi:hypothetical protein
MYDRYSDFVELRPTGEASHIPDTMLDDGCESDLLAGNASRRALVATLMRRRQSRKESFRAGER